MTQQSEIIYHKSGGVSLVGPDAVNLYRAIALSKSLALYHKIKMLPTRGVTATDMLTMATQYTGKTYKRGQYLLAADDIDVWVQTMKAALPTTNER